MAKMMPRTVLPPPGFYQPQIPGQGQYGALYGQQPMAMPQQQPMPEQQQGGGILGWLRGLMGNSNSGERMRYNPAIDTVQRGRGAGFDLGRQLGSRIAALQRLGGIQGQAQLYEAPIPQQPMMHHPAMTTGQKFGLLQGNQVRPQPQPTTEQKFALLQGGNAPPAVDNLTRVMQGYYPGWQRR